MTPFIRCFVVVAFLCVVSAFAQLPSPAPSTAGIFRTAKTIFIDANSEFMDKNALERELLKHPDFSQLGFTIVLDEKKADLILAVSRKSFTTRFILTTIDAPTRTVVTSCRESSIGGEIEPKLAKCFIKQAKAARAQVELPAPTSAKNPAMQQKDSPEPKKDLPGVWVDPATELMWAGKDNGRDVNWREAAKSCENLRLGGYADWRMATIEELEGIYDKTANAPGLAGKNGTEPSTWHIKGNLFLTGDQWSRTRVPDPYTRKPGGSAWYFDFGNKIRKSEDATWSGRGAGHFLRTLCVRSSGN